MDALKMQQCLVLGHFFIMIDEQCSFIKNSRVLSSIQIPGKVLVARIIL